MPNEFPRRLSIRILGNLTCVLLLCACSAPTRYHAENLANEPIHHQENYSALGLNATLWKNNEPQDSLVSLEVSPHFIYQSSVTEWASYNFLPVNWNLLLTGNQYRDSTHLILHRAHIGLNFGLTGFSYSAQDGVELPAAINLMTKFLYDDGLYSVGSVGGALEDLQGMKNGMLAIELGSGVQVSEGASAELSWSGRKFYLAEGYYAEGYGYVMRNREVEQVVALGLSNYFTRHHLLKLKGRFNYMEFEISRQSATSAELGYTYVF